MNDLASAKPQRDLSHSAAPHAPHAGMPHASHPPAHVPSASAPHASHAAMSHAAPPTKAVAEILFADSETEPDEVQREDDVKEVWGEEQLLPLPSASSAPDVGEKAEEADTEAGHVFLWLVRSNRASTCSGCNEKIHPWQFKIIYHPDPGDSRSTWQGRKSIWKYAHIQAACLKVFARARPWLGKNPGAALRYQTDIMQQMKESMEQRAFHTDEAETRFRREFSAAFA